MVAHLRPLSIVAPYRDRVAIVETQWFQPLQIEALTILFGNNSPHIVRGFRHLQIQDSRERRA